MLRLIFLGLFVMISTHTRAQWDFGAYVNISRVQLSGDGPKDFSYQASYQPNLGAIINLYFKPDARVSFQPGFAINKPVLRYRDRKLDEKRDSVKLNLNYARLPVYLDVISDNGKWHYTGGVDVQIGLNQVGSPIGSDETINLNEELRNVNPVVIFGFGRRIPVGRGSLCIDIRFGQSILNVSNRKDDTTSLVPRIKTSSFELLVSYELNSHLKRQE